MERVILVEDDELKAEQISELLREEFSVVIEIASSWCDGLSKLKAETWDFLLLDIALPQFSNTSNSRRRFRPFGGTNILDEINRVGKLVPFIAVTGYDEIGEGNRRETFSDLEHRLYSDFPNHCCGVILSKKLDWISTLAETLRENFR